MVEAYHAKYTIDIPGVTTPHSSFAEADVKSLFQEMDLDHNGSLDPSELKPLLSRLFQVSLSVRSHIPAAWYQHLTNPSHLISGK